MSAETEQLLAKVRNVRNVSVDGELVSKATRFMPPSEASAKKEELARIDEILSPDNRNSLPGHTVIDEDAMRHMVGYRKFLRKDLAENVAPDALPGETKDALHARQKFLEDQFTPGMDEQEIMRRNPPGAVGKYLKWQKEHTDHVLEWKNIRRVLNPQDDSDDLANIETLRRSNFVPGTASQFDATAQVTGHFAMSQQAKENWPEGMNEMAENSPYARKLKEELEQTQREIAELKALFQGASVKPAKRGGAMSQEKREAQSRKMKERWAARKAPQEVQS